MARVVELSYYPVKGCAGTSVREALLTPAGLAHDRSFMVVSEESVYRTQRRDPLLAVVRPLITPDGGHLTLTAPGAEPPGHCRARPACRPPRRPPRPRRVATGTARLMIRAEPRA